jgi:sugar-specific transcriptional regulator TrmB
MYQDFLTKAGLTADQAKIYEILVKNGTMPARKISLLSGMKRPLCYKIVDQLISLELVEKIDKKVNLFSPTHPSKVADLITRQQDSLRIAEQSLKSVLGNLISDFNLYSEKPNVRFYEGVSGVQVLYDDIIMEKKDILLFRSPMDDSRADLADIISKQLKRQVEAGIHTRAITPMVADLIETVITKDAERLVTRCIVPKDEFMIPAQVIVYGDKVALTSYGESLVTTIIQNPDIREMFTVIFDYIWKKSGKYSKDIVRDKSLKQTL